MSCFLSLLFLATCLGSEKASLVYEENEPLRRVFVVQIFPDLTVLVSDKKLKPFCATPAAGGCWQQINKSQKISLSQYNQLMNFIADHRFENLPAEEPFAPGKASVHLSFAIPGKNKVTSVRLATDDLSKYPDFRQFQKMIYSLITRENPEKF